MTHEEGAGGHTPCMDRNHYRFRTVWTLSAPAATVYGVLERIEDYPRWWPQVREVARLDDLADGRATGVDAGGARAVLLRRGPHVDALLARCTHRGGPLDEGEAVDGCVTCPWHGSRFRADDGTVVRGPASVPQPVLDVRVVAGAVEVRHPTPALLTAERCQVVVW